LPDFSLYNIPKRENIPNDHKITRWPRNIPNGKKYGKLAVKNYGHKIPKPTFQSRQKFAQTEHFGMKIFHLATLHRRKVEMSGGCAELPKD
jgi:hypothetical protein